MTKFSAKIAAHRPHDRTSTEHDMWSVMVKLVAMNLIPMKWSEQFEHACNYGGIWPND